MDEESSSNLSRFTDIIQAYEPYSLIFNLFAVLNQELHRFVSGRLLLCDGGPGSSYLQGCCCPYSKEAQAAQGVFQFCVGIFLDIIFCAVCLL